MSLLHAMIAPCSPASSEQHQLLLDSPSSDSHCAAFMNNDPPNASDESPSFASSDNTNSSPLRDHHRPASPVNLHEYPLTSHPHGQSLAAPHGESRMAAPDHPASSPLLIRPLQTSDNPVCACVEPCGIMYQLSKAARMSIASNSHVHIADSCGQAMDIAMEGSGPATGVMSICGMRSEMEDAVTIAHRFLRVSCRQAGGCSGACLAHADDEHDAKTPLHFFGVYDGHGGSQVSNFCKDMLHRTLANEFQSCNDDNDDGDRTGDTPSARAPWDKCWEKAMFSTFEKMDAQVEGFSWRAAGESKGSARERMSEPLAPETVGSTAVIAVVGACQIIVANCGDSRAVLSRRGRAIALSVDHKPNREDEMERIEAAGGKVICWNGCRVFGVLAMSRAIGDRYLKPYVISEPEVRCIARSDDDDCLILASDGLWDVVTNEEACEVARRCLARRVMPAAANGGCTTAGFTRGSNDKNAEAAAALLTKMALAQGSHDNISVVVVDLKDRKSN